MTRCTDRDLGELLAPYLLRSCTAAEAASVAGHLRECATCARDAERLRPARDLLMLAVTPVRPSSQLKARVMAAVEAEARLFAAARAPVDPAPARSAARTPGRGAAGHLLERCRAPVAGWALAGCVLGLVVLGAVLATAFDHRPAPIREIVARVNAAQAPDGRARIRIDGDRASLDVQGLPAAGRGRTYQVWLVTGTSRPRPTHALFAVESGRGSVALPAGIRRADEVLVTSEPRGGSRSPTRPPVLTVAL
jgi:hypothetical protein